MADTITIEVQGIAEVNRMLDEVSTIVAARAYTRGLDRAGKVIIAALWPRVPVDLKAVMNKAHGGVVHSNSQIGRAHV